jgi:hypothetical protein
MMPQGQITLKVARDFGETFNAATKFIRQNFVHYFTCMLLLAGPLVLIYSISYAYYDSVIQYKQSLVKIGRLYSFSKYGWEYLLAVFFQFASSLSMMCTSYAYLVVYNEKGKGNFGATDVMRKMNVVIGKIISAFLLYGLLTLIFIGAIVFLTAMVIEASPILGGFLVLCLLAGAAILTPNIMWQVSIAFLVIIYDEEIPISAYGRTREVMKDNYWWTWLVMTCSSLMFLFMAFLFMIPEVVYTVVSELSVAEEPSETSFLFIIISTACTFIATLIYSMNYIVAGFHFFSLAEKKDGEGLLQRINDIGKGDTIITEQLQN